jgi:membrane-associated phospholipid phosphatase
MYLGAHHLSDVVCAAILGFLSALIIAHLMLRSPPITMQRPKVARNF